MAQGTVVIFDSEKGGVGKSFLSMSFTEWVWHRLRMPVVVVECNAEIPDVGRHFKDDIPVVNIDVRAPGGWSRIADVVDQHKGKIVVVNLPSNVAGYYPEDRKGTLSGMRRLLDVRVLLSWVLNHEVDGILAMRREVKRSGQLISDVVVIPNLVHSRLKDFAWMQSQTRVTMAEKGNLELVFPELWSPMAVTFRQVGVSFDEMRKGLATDQDGNLYPAGVRLTLFDWLRRTDLLWDALAVEMGWTRPEATNQNDDSATTEVLPDADSEVA